MVAKHTDSRIDDKVIEQLAERASADRRSVIRRLAGLPVRGKAGERIDRALAETRGEQ
jgi:hypothetical protein